MKRKINRAVIGIGSNISAYANIKVSIELIQKVFNIARRSSLLETDPVGIEEQPKFVNATILIETDLDAHEVNIELKRIEDVMGRNRNRAKYGPREIDLDIIMWNDEVVDEDFYSRGFLQKLTSEVISA